MPPKKMKRVKLIEPNKAIIEEVDYPKPNSREIVMKIAYCGICGSDLHASIGKHPFVPLPATPGHEFSGWVEEVGSEVTEFKPGDRVTAEPNLVCGKCYNCRIGRYNICENLRVMGCQGDGAMAEYFLLPADKTVPIPDSLSLKHAALVEPLAVGVHAAHRAGDLYMKNVVIVGAGMIGLSVLANVVRAGAKNIWVTDLDDKRLELAKEMGATRVINAKQDVVEIIRKEAGYEGVDVAFEAVGIEASLRTCMDVIRKGAKVIVIGVFGDESKIKSANLQDWEMELIGTLMYVRRDIEEAIQILAEGGIPSDKIIGKIFPLSEANEAFEWARTHKETIKTVLEINKE
ncbi:MAG: zinc-dependent alcohol dehydrogenase [Promethearchaeota archaeon]